MTAWSPRKHRVTTWEVRPWCGQPPTGQPGHPQLETAVRWGWPSPPPGPFGTSDGSSARGCRGLTARTMDAMDPVRLALPDGTAITVRPMVPADADGLELLYAGLSMDDLHLRFFSVWHPPKTFFEHLAHIAEAGGYGIVAVLDDPTARLVGEADYARLDDGDGELAITVAPDWRGWLGPYLLDRLLECAAARGVRNLQAEVLVENHRMLALVRRRGYATLDHDGFTTVRVTVGAGTAMPTWPGSHDRRRVLVEASGGRWHAEDQARRHGYQVIVCPGPRPGVVSRCPALGGEPCPLAASADAIVWHLPADRPRSGEVLEAHRAVHPGVPVVVEGPESALQGDILAALDALFSPPPPGAP